VGASISLCACSTAVSQKSAAADAGPPVSAAGASPVGMDGGSPTPDTDPGGTICVNGVAVPRGSAFETGGTAPAIPPSGSATRLPPLSGGTLIVLADGTTLVASDPDRDQLYVFDADKGVVRSTVSLQAGDEPGRLVEDAAARVHVILRRGGALITLDPKTSVVQARRTVCSAPRGVTYDRATDQLHVACAGGELVSLPASGGSATRRLAFDRDLRDVVMGANGSLLV